MRLLVLVAVTGFTVSVASFLTAAAMVASAAASSFSFGEILGLGDDRERCVNELGDAGGRPTIREFAWQGRDEIRLNVPGTLHYRPGARDTVEVRGPAYLLGHLEIDKESISYDCSPRRNAPRIEIKMVGEGIREFSIRGSGDMFLEALDEERVEISIAGTGLVTATGEVGRLSLSVAGSSDAHLGDLSVRVMEIAIAGSGDATVSPLESLEVFIAGSGDVDLPTDPANLETSIIGSGSIRRPSPSN